MGAAGSSLVPAKKIKSANELILKTKDIRQLSDALFTFMFSKWDLKTEIWEISKNPDEYVVAVSDLITSQFHVLGYTTKRNQIGEIYFQKYDKLAPPKEADEQSQRGSAGIVKHRENTQIIAFYFVRLFQIMGAMLMVVKDISFPMYDPITKTITNVGKSQDIRRPYVNQESMTLERFKSVSSPYQVGGGGGIFPTQIPLGPYEFLRYYLTSVSQEIRDIYRVKYIVTLPPGNLYQITPNLFFEYKLPDPLPANVMAGPSIPEARQKFHVVTKRDGEVSAMMSLQEATVSMVNPNNLVGYLSPGDERFNTPEKQLERYHSIVTFKLSGSGGGRSPDEATVNRVENIASSSRSYKSGVEYKFETGTTVDSLLGEYDPRKDFTKILERVIITAMRKTDRSIRLYTIKRSDNIATTQAVAVGEMPTTIKSSTIDELYKSLRPSPSDKDKIGTQPHCIARAIQLLDTESLHSKNPTKGKTNICRIASDNKEATGNLLSYKPIKSLAQLYGKVDPVKFKESKAVLEAFVDTQKSIEGKTITPLSVSGLKTTQPDEAASLSMALQRISKAFAITQAQGANPFDSFSDITVPRPKGCGPSSAVQQEIGDRSVTNALQSTAQELMAYHVNHTIEIAKFLRVIFNITRGPNGAWTVEGPRVEILYAGFPILNQLTDQARELLVDYYAGCETLYQSGVKVWSDAQPVVEGPQQPVATQPIGRQPSMNDSRPPSRNTRRNTAEYPRG